MKPFTATVTASFNREDIMNSFLVDAGLRRLVARALSLRVRSVRDLFDGAVFYGRTWKLFEQNAPLVEVPKLQDVQFDSRNRLILTGRAKIRVSYNHLTSLIVSRNNSLIKVLVIFRPRQTLLL